MQLSLPWSSPPVRRLRVVTVGQQRYPVDIVRRRGARRYVVRIGDAGSIRLTVPYGSTIRGGLAFIDQHRDWIARQMGRRLASAARWHAGGTCVFRGDPVTIEVEGGRVRFGSEDAGPVRFGHGLRPQIVDRMRAIARTELPERCAHFAARHGVRVNRISVRNQRSRWGACSSRGTITLNWRLVQAPIEVRDYVILHELAHVSVPNHSRAFWRRVAELCPDWRDAERWLKQSGAEIL